MSEIVKAARSDLGRSISSGYLLFLLNNLVALFLTPYLLKFITKEDYGFYILCVDFLAWVVFLEFGTNKVVESKAAHLISNENYTGLSKTFNSTFHFQILIGLLIVPVYFVIVKTGIVNEKVENLNIIIWVFSISAGLSIIKNLFSTIIVASKKVHLDNRIQIWINVLNYSLILLLVPLVGVTGLAVINLISVILMLYRSNYRVQKMFPVLSLNSSNFDWQELKSLISQGIYFSLGSLATVVLVKLDSFIIGRDFGLAEVASFFITIKLYALAQKVFQVFFSNFRPHVAHLYGQGNLKKMSVFYDLISPFTLGFSAFSIGLIMIFNSRFVGIWVGDLFFLNNEFNVLFGFYILLDLMTIPSRIILTSSLYKVKRQSAFRLYEATSRIIGIVLFIDLIGISILPITSIISCVLLCNLFYYFLLRGFFKNYDIILGSNAELISFVLVVVLFVFYYNNKLDYFGLWLVLFSFIYLFIIFIKGYKSFRNLNFLLK